MQNDNDILDDLSTVTLQNFYYGSQDSESRRLCKYSDHLRLKHPSTVQLLTPETIVELNLGECNGFQLDGLTNTNIAYGFIATTDNRYKGFILEIGSSVKILEDNILQVLAMNDNGLAVVGLKNKSYFIYNNGKLTYKLQFPQNHLPGIIDAVVVSNNNLILGSIWCEDGYNCLAIWDYKGELTTFPYPAGLSSHTNIYGVSNDLLAGGFCQKRTINSSVPITINYKTRTVNEVDISCITNNKSGQICSVSSTGIMTGFSPCIIAEGDTVYKFILTPQPLRLETPYNEALPLCINKNRLIGGRFNKATNAESEAAFIIDARRPLTKFYDLNDFQIIHTAGWSKISSADFINDNNWIVGYGVKGNRTKGYAIHLNI